MAAANKPLSRAGSAMATTAQDAVNVQVVLRCRPMSKEETAARQSQVVKCDEALRTVTLTQSVPGSKQQTSRTYHFDKVFAPDATQERLYSTAVAGMVEEVLEGFNCTIFAYGQTGTGKTHTMTGDITDGGEGGVPHEAGVIPRAIHQIFGYLDGIASEYSVKCSYLELYNEEITDLLTVGNDVPKVRIMEDRSGVVLAGIEESIVKNSAEIFALLEQGSAKRRTAETLLNKQSSRSHSVFIVTVSVREVTPEGDEVIRVGKLYLVDLAGSENITRSGAVDQRAKEAGNINKSLLTLGRVITALVEGQGHVPYRDSKLTRLLRDSLGGKTKTCIIATIAPTTQCQEETLSTLDYAHRAKNIKNKPEVNAKISKTTHLKEMNFEIEKLKQMLIATREKNGVYVPSQQYEQECEERRQLGARVEELEGEAEAVAAQHELAREEWQREMREQEAGHQRQLTQVRNELAQAQAELAAARLAIAERDHALDVQQRCEAALASHAAQLNDALAGAAADVAQLFQRWDDKNDLEDANLALVQELRDAAVQRLAAIEAAVAGAASAQAQRFASVQQLLAGFAERKAAEIARLQADMSKLQAQLDATHAAAAAAAAQLEQAGAAGLEGIAAQHRQYMREAKDSATAAVEQLSSAYSALSASLGAEQQQLDTFLAEQRAAGASALSATQAVVTSVREQLGAAKGAAAIARSEVTQRLGAAASAVDAFEAAFVAKAQAEQAALVEQIGDMLASFVAKAEAEVKSASSGLRSRITADEASLQQRLEDMETHAHTSLAVLAKNENAATTAHAAVQAALQEGCARLGTAMQGSVRRGADLQTAASQQAAEAASKLEAHSSDVQGAVGSQTAALKQLAGEERAKCGSAAQAAAALRATLQDAAAAGLAADSAAAGDLQALTQLAKVELAGFASEQQAAVAALSGVVQESVGRRYASDRNRDKVPARLERAVPPRGDIDALRAPPAEACYAEYRAQHAASAADRAEAGEEEPAGEDMEAAPSEEEAGQEHEENADAGNVAAPAVPPLDTSGLPPLKPGKQRGVLSPSALGKRGRTDGETPVSGRASPSKLRGAFARSQQRGTRS